MRNRPQNRTALFKLSVREEKTPRSVRAFVDRFFTLLFDYIKPEYWSFASLIVITGTFLFSTIIYSTVDEFDIFRVYVSSLPVIHSSGIFFGIGLGLAVVLMIPFIYALVKWLWSDSKKGNTLLILAFSCAVGAFGGLNVLLFFDMETDLKVHDLGSAIFFVCCLFTTVFFTATMEVVGKASKMQWIITTNIITLAVLFFPWYFYTFFELMHPNEIPSFDDWVISMGSLDPKMDSVRYFEWIAIIFAVMWIAQTTFHYRKHRLMELQALDVHQESTESPRLLDENKIKKISG